MPAASFDENDPYDYGTRAVLETHRRAFAPGFAPNDPRFSPVHADLSGLSPALVVVGEREIPRDDIVALAERLKAAGVATDVHVASEMPHNALFFAAFHPSGRAALEAAVGFTRRLLG
jgi:acetyl esterase/lipase